MDDLKSLTTDELRQRREIYTAKLKQVEAEIMTRTTGHESLINKARRLQYELFRDYGYLVSFDTHGDKILGTIPVVPIFTSIKVVIVQGYDPFIKCSLNFLQPNLCDPKFKELLITIANLDQFKRIQLDDSISTILDVKIYLRTDFIVQSHRYTEIVYKEPYGEVCYGYNVIQTNSGKFECMCDRNTLYEPGDIRCACLSLNKKIDNRGVQEGIKIVHLPIL